MTLETLNSLFPIYRRLPKLGVNPLVGSGRIGTDQRAWIRRSFAPRSYNHELPPAPSASPATNYVGPSVSCIPGRVIPVPRCTKWQQQPKLQQPPQQRIPSNAG